MMIQFIITTLVSVACLVSICAFSMLLAADTSALSSNELAEVDERLQNSLNNEQEGISDTVGVSEITQIRVMPFGAKLAEFNLSPHKVVAFFGLVGACLLLGAFFWCLIVPFNKSIRTQWQDREQASSTFTPKAVIHKEDGTVETIDLDLQSER